MGSGSVASAGNGESTTTVRRPPGGDGGGGGVPKTKQKKSKPPASSVAAGTGQSAGNPASAAAQKAARAAAVAAAARASRTSSVQSNQKRQADQASPRTRTDPTKHAALTAAGAVASTSAVTSSVQVRRARQQAQTQAKKAIPQLDMSIDGAQTAGPIAAQAAPPMSSPLAPSVPPSPFFGNSAALADGEPPLASGLPTAVPSDALAAPQSPGLRTAHQELPEPGADPMASAADDYVARSPITKMIGVGHCVQRLIRFNEDQRRRTKNYGLDDFWKPFVSEYFAPTAKLLLDVYNDIARTPKSIELPADVIARIFKAKYDSGVQEEKLLMENPCEFLLRNEIVVVDCPRAIVVAVYEHSKVYTEGHLRVSFSKEMKILCWEFSTRSHEELVNRNVVQMPPPAANELGLSPTVARYMQIAQALNDLRPAIYKTLKANVRQGLMSPDLDQTQRRGPTQPNAGQMRHRDENNFQSFSESSRTIEERNSNRWLVDGADGAERASKRRK